MQKLQTLKVLEDELGEVLKSRMSGESLYYSVHWEEIQTHAGAVARKNHVIEPGDVRVAGYALDLLGFPNHYSEADQDEKGNRIIYWR
jgi:hypothetical protein